MCFWGAAEGIIVWWVIFSPRGHLLYDRGKIDGGGRGVVDTRETLKSKWRMGVW